MKNGALLFVYKYIRMGWREGLHEQGQDWGGGVGYQRHGKQKKTVVRFLRGWGKFAPLPHLAGKTPLDICHSNAFCMKSYKLPIRPLTTRLWRHRFVASAIIRQRTVRQLYRRIRTRSRFTPTRISDGDHNKRLGAESTRGQKVWKWTTKNDATNVEAELQILRWQGFYRAHVYLTARNKKRIKNVAWTSGGSAHSPKTPSPKNSTASPYLCVMAKWQCLAGHIRFGHLYNAQRPTECSLGRNYRTLCGRIQRL